ncbi:MAG: macro domain-containing protein [Firmicutes bacterium]|nr:macro domain-containing protein [Bacillota bacterium]
MPFEIIRNDITKVRADAVVNTANPHVAVGSGVDRAIYEAAGRDALLAERAVIGELRPGECAATPAFELPAKYIIHTVGPAWEGGSAGEIETLARCYRGCLEKAEELKCGSVAFPLISSGTYGFPKDAALKTAVSEISSFLFGSDMTVYLVVYNKEAFEISGKVFSGVKSYIEESEIRAPERSRNVYYPEGSSVFGGGYRNIPADGAAESMAVPARSGGAAESMAAPARSSAPTSAPKRKAGILPTIGSFRRPSKSIDDVIKEKDETFQQYLFRIIDRKGLTDPEVYKKANIDRKHFSKIRGNVDYNPSRKTALALAVALELNLDETRDLLLKAGLALTHSSTFDLIMEYCIEHKVYDIYEINCILFSYGQPTLGA